VLLATESFVSASMACYKDTTNLHC